MGLEQIWAPTAACATCVVLAGIETLGSDCAQKRLERFNPTVTG